MFIHGYLYIFIYSSLHQVCKSSQKGRVDFVTDFEVLNFVSERSVVEWCTSVLLSII